MFSTCTQLKYHSSLFGYSMLFVFKISVLIFLIDAITYKTKKKKIYGGENCAYLDFIGFLHFDSALEQKHHHHFALYLNVLNEKKPIKRKTSLL